MPILSFPSFVQSPEPHASHKEHYKSQQREVRLDLITKKRLFMLFILLLRLFDFLVLFARMLFRFGMIFCVRGRFFMFFLEFSFGNFVMSCFLLDSSFENCADFSIPAV